MHYITSKFTLIIILHNEKFVNLYCYQNAGRRQIPGSCAFVPPVVGMIIAGEVVKDLTGMRAQRGR